MSWISRIPFLGRADGPRAIANAFVATIAGSVDDLDLPSAVEKAQGLLPKEDDALASVAVELQRREAAIPRDRYGGMPPGDERLSSALRDALRTLSRRKLPFTDEQLVALAEAVPAPIRAWGAGDHIALPLAALAHRLQERSDDQAGLAAARTFLAKVEAATQVDAGYAERTKILLRIRGLLSGGGDLDEAAANGFVDGDAWGAAMRVNIVPEFAGAPGVRDLVGLATRRISSKVPTTKWRKECARVLADCPAAADVLRSLLEPLPRTPDTLYDTSIGTCASYLKPENAETAKTLLWMLTEARPAWAPKLLSDLAIHCAPGPRDQKLANAAVLILGALGDRAAVGQLARARLKIRNRNTRKQIDEALATASAKAGVPAAELLEMCVPDFGLGPDGRKSVAVGNATAVLGIDGPSEVRLAWRDSAGVELKAPPAAIRESHASEISALKADVKEIRSTLGTERARIEELLAGTRTWPVAVWTERYVRHPVTGPVARGLIWSVSAPGGARRTGLVAAVGGTLTDSRGEPFAVDAGGDVRLLHPIHSAPDEIEAWRARIVAAEIVQPIKQAFREVYVLTPAEAETRVYSNRFAGHVLRYGQASALMKARMWHANALGGWDGGYEGVAKKEFPDQGVRAEFFHDAIPDDGTQGVVVHCTTDQVRFFAVGGGPDALPLSEVPPLVFSEAMRDVDLFVSVASVAADPNWTDRGENRRFADAWTTASFGELLESAKVRRDALLRIVPKLRIADRCTVEDRWLVVRGDLATYRIHLGSTSIQMEPGSRYLCIVVDRGASRGAASRVFLPFEEDGTLSVILSKAFLLADDRKIKDETILHQIRRA